MNNWKEIFKDIPDTGREKWFIKIAAEKGVSAAFVKKHYYVNFNNKHKALQQEVEKIGIPIESVTHYWHKGKQFSIFSKQNHATYFDIRDEIVSSMVEHAPKYEEVKYGLVDDGHLLVLDPADIHIGKLSSKVETGEEYNSDIAEILVNEAVDGILQKVSAFKFDTILLIIGNDILHTDNTKRTTTSGTPQDTDKMWYDNFLIAKQIYISTIEKLIKIAPLTVQYNPSNHDYTHGFFLADTISSWFANCKSVKFDVSPSHRKYFVYGKNLIGTTHGDGAKLTDLPLLMAQEASEKWHECKHRYWYEHHIHHKRSKEIGSVTIESVRSPSGTDSWHHRNGYQHSAKAIEGFIHHKENGQIARITHIC